MGELARLIAEHGVWGLPVASFWLATRSRPARTLSRVVSAEIRRRYEVFLRRRGVQDDEIRRLLDDDRDSTNDKDEPPKAIA